MKLYNTAQLRNIGLFSHGGAGKTTLLEAMLFTSKATTRLGRVEEGNTVSDYDPDEIKRHISVQLSIAPVEWQDTKINVIDTPGYAEFVGEVKAGIRVADTAVLLVDASAGVEVGTEQMWRYAEERGCPRFVVINKMDRENADFMSAWHSTQNVLGKKCAPLQVPIGSQQSFRGVVDLLHQKAYIYEGNTGKFSIGAVPADMEAEVQQLRDALIERVCETDDDLTMKYLEGEELSVDELDSALKNGVKNGDIVPVLAASGLLNIGTSQLLDNIVIYAPSPSDMGVTTATNAASGQEVQLQPSDASPLTALVFKTIRDQFGKQTYFRVFTGVFRSDSHVLNSTRNVDERIGQVYVMRGKEQLPVQELHAGDMGVVVKLAETQTGETLCAPGTPLVLDGVDFPSALFSASIAPRTKADLDKMGSAVHHMVEEDPTIHVGKDPITGQTVLSAMGESHVQIVADRMKRKFGVDVTVGLPVVPYRETITSKVDRAHYRHKKQTGGHGQFADVVLELEPWPDAEFEFGDRIVGGAVPKNFIPAVEKGIREALSEGVLAGYPVVNIRAVLYDGSFHPVDSSEMAFKLASNQAFKEGMHIGRPVLLEPIMILHIIVPDNYTGDIMSDLNGRRGRVLGMNPQGNGFTVIDAQAPLSEVQRYVSDLRSITQGRGSFDMEFDHYEQVPAHVADRVIEEARKHREAAHA
ncbi:MAG: elongation factor G [Chloroflexota bacterium]|nr:elongation factor G [Chloroflexota bacterium]MDQ5865876.1 elongation factor G [Chloroflexota bacterium]